jgi:hypothetical protein
VGWPGKNFFLKMQNANSGLNEQAVLQSIALVFTFKYKKQQNLLKFEILNMHGSAKRFDKILHFNARNRIRIAQ